jgi:hypothetical protein
MNRPSLPGPLNKRYGYHAARWRAGAVRRMYGGPWVRRLSRPPAVPLPLDAHLVLFSGERDALEQLASLRSFIRNVGRPARITLGSDGTHTPETLARLRELFDGLEVVFPDQYLEADLPDAVRRFADAFVSGRKLAFYLSLQPDYPFVYADSDVLFFPGAAAIRALLAERSGPPLYMVDCVFQHDERMLSEELLASPPVNSGFWILRAPLDWGEALERLASVEGSFLFHTEQTVLHVAMHRAGAEPMDPQRYVLGVHDRFDYRTRPEREAIVLRHYVTGIRHQFWLNVGAA